MLHEKGTEEIIWHNATTYSLPVRSGLSVFRGRMAWQWNRRARRRRELPGRRRARQGRMLPGRRWERRRRALPWRRRARRRRRRACAAEEAADREAPPQGGEPPGRGGDHGVAAHKLTPEITGRSRRRGRRAVSCGHRRWCPL